MNSEGSLTGLSAANFFQAELLARASGGKQNDSKRNQQNRAFRIMQLSGQLRNSRRVG